MPDYKDDDLVYIDPAKKAVVGKVEFDKNGKPIKKEMVIDDSKNTDESDEKDKEKGKGRGKRRSRNKKQYYIWGTYRSAKKMYNIEGKWREEEENKTFDDALQLALKEPYWD